MGFKISSITERKRVESRSAEDHYGFMNPEEMPKLPEARTAWERRVALEKLRADLDRFAASLPPQSDSAPLIREDREDR